MNWGDARLPDRFWDKVVPEPNSGCWLWIAHLDKSGYARFGWNGRAAEAYRVAFVVARGEVPQGLELDHRCRLRCCVNPAHLEAVTHRVNMHRSASPSALNLLKQTCPKGHPYDMIHASGGRRCRTCENENWMRRYRERRQTDPLT